MPQDQAPRLKPNRSKILEAVLYLIQYAQGRGYEFTQFSIVKSMFVADVSHIEKFGRPVTFDNYTAMKNGPVPSATYNLVRTDGRATLKAFGLRAPLWEAIPAPHLAPTAYKFSNIRRAPDVRKLSETDRDELEQAADLVNKLGFFKVRDFTHEHPAYKSAWRENGDKKGYAMDYRLMMPTLDDEDFIELVEASRYS